MSPLLWFAFLRAVVALAAHHGWGTGVLMFLAGRFTLKLTVILRAKQEDLPEIARALWKRLGQ